MNILGIESSCDETAAAVVSDGTEILSSIISSSHQLHTQFGGILPELASREQLTYMLPVVSEALSSAFPHTKNIQERIDKIDAIAVTVGPGLIGSLLMGVETAKAIAFVTNKPLITVNHVLAHMYANFTLKQTIPFPAIALIVSGGHTELFVMTSKTHYEWIGGTIDDAAGEAFDKAARLLGFGNEGGKAIALAAQQFTTNKSPVQLSLPRPLLHDNTFNFSFSGLKTALQREWIKYKETPNIQSVFAYELQEAITDVLVEKTIRAAEKHSVSSILIGGGVSANTRLREKLQLHAQNFQLFFPPIELCTDNAVTTASYAYFHQLTHNYREITASPSLTVEV